MNCFTLCYSLVLLLVSSEPVWGETVLFGIVKHVWRNGVCNQNRFELHGKTSSKKIELYYARTPPKFFQSFVLVDFTTLINNLVYLDVQRQRDRVSVAFESISGAHNVFRYLYPNSARLADDILVARVALQFSDGSLHRVANKAAFTLFHVEGKFLRLVLHSRIGAKLPIAMFHTGEFNIQSIQDTKFVILSVKPADGEGEVFYYGLEFPSMEEKEKLLVETAGHALDMGIHAELDARFRAFFNGESVPPLAENYFVKRGTQLVAELIL